MSARDHAGPERRASGPGLGFDKEQLEELAEFLSAVRQEHVRFKIEKPGEVSSRAAWLLKPGLAAGVLGAVLAAQVLAGMAGCQRVMGTVRAMDAHVTSDDKQHAAEALKWEQSDKHWSAVDLRLERIESDVRWLKDDRKGKAK